MAASGTGINDSVSTVIQFLQSHGLQDLSELLSKEASALLSGPEAAHLIDVAAGGTNFNNDTSISEELFEDEYESLMMLVEKSLDKFKPELGALLFPTFAQMYIQLLEAERDDPEVKQFMNRFGPQQESIWNTDVDELRTITDKAQLATNQVALILKNHKYLLRMSRGTLNILRSYLALHPAIDRIVRNHLQIEASDSAPRSRDVVLSVTGSLVGESLKSMNKSKMLFGVQREDFATVLDTTGMGDDEANMSKKKKAQRVKEARDSKKNKDPNAPAVTRIPLPDWTEQLKAEKRALLKDASKRVKLTAAGNQPTVCMYTVLNADQGVSSCQISEDGSMLALGYTNSNVQVWSMDQNAPLKAIKKSSDLDSLDLDAPDVRTQLLDPSHNNNHYTLTAHCGPVFATCFSPDRRLLLSCSEDSTIRLWSTQVWRNLVVYRTGGYPVNDVNFCSRGYYFATANADNTAAVWCTDRMQPIRLFADHLSHVGCVQFHPNCNYVATGCDDRIVRVWDMLNGQCVRYLTGHNDILTKLAFSHDGKTLAATAADGQTLIWDVAQSQLLAALRSEDDKPCHSLCFSRDNAVLAIGGYNRIQFVRLDQWSGPTTSSDGADARPVCTDINDVLLTCYETKNTPVLSMQFTSKNVLLAAGPYDQI